jgi:Holliday junction DNA helicase RuvA
VKEIADAIQRLDTKWLTTLPGVGTATAEQIIATLRRKVTRFALMPTIEGTAETAAGSATQGNVVEDSYQALLSVGHTPAEARHRLDQVLTGGKAFKSVEEVLTEIYNKQGK